jgi:hypothetical protein
MLYVRGYTMTGSNPVDPIPDLLLTASQQAVLRLLIIPLLVWSAWMAEIFLLEGTRSLFLNPAPLPLAVYTVVGCILTGIFVPVLILHRSFISGAVNMFQAGFGSVRRTLAVCTLTAIACFLFVGLMVPDGYQRMALPGIFLLCLPTAIAAVMICWVLVGTHLQALVRPGGAAFTIPTGVVITAVLFGLTTQVHTPASGLEDPLAAGILLGLVTALFFFSIRDVYATGIVLTTGMALVYAGRIDPGTLSSMMPGVAFSALLGILALVATHGYLSRRYVTIKVLPGR